ncbi:MAG: hypothetical protein PHE52_01505 [Candidatus Pacebacteria bacterium]|nr:hypothetical protein [Candidatus Paceibacterota bacterium]
MKTTGRIGLIASFFLCICMFLAMILAEVCEPDPSKHGWDYPLPFAVWLEGTVLLLVLTIYSLKSTDFLENFGIASSFSKISSILCAAAGFTGWGYLVLWPILLNFHLVLTAVFGFFLILVFFGSTVYVLLGGR